MDSPEYVYYESRKDELIRDLKIDGDDLALEMEVFRNGEWHLYYGDPGDLDPIEAEEAAAMMAA